MIIDVLLNVLFFVPYQLLNLLLPLEFDLNLDTSLFDTVASLFNCLEYILPINIFIICIGVKLVIRFWIIPYSIILRIKSFIPSMGN